MSDLSNWTVPHYTFEFFLIVKHISREISFGIPIAFGDFRCCSIDVERSKVLASDGVK